MHELQRAIRGATRRRRRAHPPGVHGPWGGKPQPQPKLHTAASHRAASELRRTTRPMPSSASGAAAVGGAAIASVRLGEVVARVGRLDAEPLQLLVQLLAAVPVRLRCSVQRAALQHCTLRHCTLRHATMQRCCNERARTAGLPQPTDAMQPCTQAGGTRRCGAPSIQPGRKEPRQREADQTGPARRLSSPRPSRPATWSHP